MIQEVGAAPVCVDLFAGLGGWAEGFLAGGWTCVGFDIERHRYAVTMSHFGGLPKTRIDQYPGQLVLQDVLTIHGRQFRNAGMIVASPPCQEFSYMAMPWKRAKQIARALRGHGEFPEGYTGSRTIAELTALFDACFRIQREASEAAGRHIPMVVENVKGAQPWVGRAKANFGSFYLWGDVAMVGNRIVLPRPQFGDTHTRPRKAQKIEAYSDPRRNGGKGSHLTSQTENLLRLYGDDAPCGCWDKDSFHRVNGMDPGEVCENAGRKVPGLNFHDYEKGMPGRSFQTAAVALSEAGLKQHGSGPVRFDTGLTKHGSHTHARKAASAQIAKIPFALSNWLARAYKPNVGSEAA